MARMGGEGGNEATSRREPNEKSEKIIYKRVEDLAGGSAVEGLAVGEAEGSATGEAEVLTGGEAFTKVCVDV